MLFDPKYGVHEKIEGYTKEHAGYCEDFVAYFSTFSPKPEWEVIGFYAQNYA